MLNMIQNRYISPVVGLVVPIQLEMVVSPFRCHICIYIVDGQLALKNQSPVLVLGHFTHQTRNMCVQGYNLYKVYFMACCKKIVTKQSPVGLFA